MREWMLAHGQQEKALWISEYGILMPADYGFTPEKVAQFMVGSFDLFDRLRDPALGYAADDDRLVQRWNWYSDAIPGTMLATCSTTTGARPPWALHLQSIYGFIPDWAGTAGTWEHGFVPVRSCPATLPMRLI